jgi:ADP-ribosylation factor-like protein 2
MAEDVTEVAPTLGFTINTLKYKEYMINLWDIGGQTTIRSYWRNYFEQTDGVIWVVDSSDKLRLNDCKEELHNLLKQEVLIF